MQINRNPSPKHLRQFGVLWFCFLGIIGVVLWHRTGSGGPATAVWLVGLVSSALGFLFSPFMRLLYLGMSYITFPIGWLVSHLVLGLTYYLVLTPIAWCLRATGRDPMTRTLDPSAASHWAPLTGKASPTDYFRQF